MSARPRHLHAVCTLRHGRALAPSGIIRVAPRLSSDFFLVEKTITKLDKGLFIVVVILQGLVALSG